MQGLFASKGTLTTGFGGLGVKGSGSGYSVWMRVCVLYFGVLKDLVGHGRSEMDLAESASVAELLEAHRGLVKGQESLWESIAVAVNQEYARAGDVLKDGDEVALLPPVSGGSLVLAGLDRRAYPRG
jgi:molybdopterin converting factor subunit 1